MEIVFYSSRMIKINTNLKVDEFKNFKSVQKHFLKCKNKYPQFFKSNAYKDWINGVRVWIFEYHNHKEF